MTYTIREASESDVSTIRKVMQQLSGEEISEAAMLNRMQFVANSPFDTLYVYEEEDVILGVLGFRIRENIEEVSKYGEVSVLVVDQEARRKGVGKQLMDYAEELAKQQGCIGTWLVSGFGREAEAHQFYKSMGYEVNGYRFVKKIP